MFLITSSLFAQDPFKIPKKERKATLFSYKNKEKKGTVFILKCFQNGNKISDYYNLSFKEYSEGLGSYEMTSFDNKKTRTMPRANLSNVILETY